MLYVTFTHWLAVNGNLDQDSFLSDCLRHYLPSFQCCFKEVWSILIPDSLVFYKFFLSFSLYPVFWNFTLMKLNVDLFSFICAVYLVHPFNLEIKLCNSRNFSPIALLMMIPSLFFFIPFFCNSSYLNIKFTELIF